MNTVRYLKVLNDPDENQRMVRKLPRYLIDRCSREVDRWLDKDDDQYQSKEGRDATDGEDGYPPFSVFCHFLQRESRIACNPVTSVKPQKEEVRKEESYRERRSNGFTVRFTKLLTNGFRSSFQIPEVHHELGNFITQLSIKSRT